MKKLTVLFFAIAMMFSLTFAGDFLSSNGTLSVNAQTVSGKRANKPGAVRRIYRGGKWVGVKVWRGGKWVAGKSWKGGKYVARKTVRGTKVGYRMTKNAGKKTFRVVKRAVY